jgi:hypothetical protein
MRLNRQVDGSPQQRQLRRALAPAQAIYHGVSIANHHSRMTGDQIGYKARPPSERVLRGSVGGGEIA